MYRMLFVGLLMVVALNFSTGMAGAQVDVQSDPSGATLDSKTDTQTFLTIASGRAASRDCAWSTCCKAGKQRKGEGFRLKDGGGSQEGPAERQRNWHQDMKCPCLRNSLRKIKKR